MDDELLTLKKRMVQSIFRIRKLATSFPDKMDSDMEQLDINMSELTLMKQIESNSIKSDDNTQITDIQKVLFVTKAAVSQMLNALEKKGYINRDIDKQNRRQLIVTLTVKGKDALKCVEKDVDDRLNEIISRLGKENTEQFITSIDRLGEVIKDIITNERK